MRDPELVVRAQHAAARLESAWERWRALQGTGESPAQPVVGYVGYGPSEPSGEPRAVIGFSADEAERLADFLEQDLADFLERGSEQGASRSQLGPGRRPAVPVGRPAAELGLELAQRLVPEQPTAGTRPAGLPDHPAS